MMSKEERDLPQALDDLDAKDAEIERLKGALEYVEMRCRQMANDSYSDVFKEGLLRQVLNAVDALEDSQ